ncbi:GNAT family N-acetyltransferase [Psychroflexus salis]|uniref:N-acetyltransferase n=1 Tax=Psychroflexus salis TaxID=1526574 RepID=A0A917A248_9FLAO|nr:GNAT family N-acetyltransferase [Psychroflexus salis]GGE23107.1 N-acetyltransferase [Psychroflexus salis]
MDFEIRRALPEDIPSILQLIQELAVYEKEPDAVEVTEEILFQYGFSEEAFFKCYVAEFRKEVIGMALFYSRFSTWKGRSIHLEDLIVTQKMRGKGVGRALLDEVVAYAHQQKLKRVEWVVLDWNTSAVEFYNSYGANVMQEWNTVHLDEQGIQNAIEKINT